MKRRITLLMASLFVGAVLLSGCGTQEKREITVMWWGDVYNYGFAKKLVDAYNATNPAKPARLMPVEGAGYNQKMLTMAASKTLPDVVLLTTPYVHDMGSRNTLLSLNKYTDTPEFIAMKKEIWPGLVESVNIGGKQLAVPIWTWAAGVYYNKDLFDKAGVPYPSKNWTFKEFEEKSRKLVIKEDGKIKTYAYNSTYFSLYDSLLMSYLYAHGGSFYSKDGRKCEMNTPASRAALKAFCDLRFKDHISPTTTEEAGMGNSGSGADLFQSGMVAMRIAGRDYMDMLRQRGGAKFRWGAAPMPRGDKPCFFQAAACLGVSADTKSPDDAWKFVSFVIGEQGQKMVTTDKSDITIYKKLTYEKSFLNYQGRPDINAMFRDMLAEAMPYPYSRFDNEWKAKAQNHLSLVELSKMSVEEACAKIAADFKP